ncbi:MAG TPA: serpin family protein [Desulfuromonadales bacterium]|nr:serpin family protein [Desulfuromonadales bacterium]
MHHLIKSAMALIAAVLLCSAGGCGGSASDGGQSANSSTGQTTGDTLAGSTVARDVSPQATDAELSAVVAGTTDFALKLFPLLDTTSTENTFFSPYSITQAFSLLAPGVRGTTLSQIEQTLYFPLSIERRNSALNRLEQLLTGRTAGTILPGGLQGPKMTNANALWGQRGFTILPAYLDTLALNFGAGLHLVDFIAATEASRQTINSWVEGQTNNRIQNLIPLNGVTVDTRLVLTNAVWFKANWATQFSKGNTANREFTNAGNSTTSVPFMRQTVSLPYAETAGCKAVDIPYAGNNLSMLVMMPAAGTEKDFTTSLTPSRLADIIKQLSPKLLDYSMPRFTFTKASPVGTHLKSLGMTDAFDPSKADLSGIDGRRDLYVSDVFHKAFIAVDEEGTEAAAATAISVGVTSMPLQPQLLTIDHPFLFLIRDRQTGLILFMGKVVAL